MKKKLGLLFLTAFVVRAIFCLSYNINELYPDAAGYHMYAVNLINNGCFSPLESPTEDVFFREPATVYILKAAYQVASFLVWMYSQFQIILLKNMQYWNITQNFIGED